MIAGNEAIFTRAQEHALEILDLEHLFGIDIEQRFQSYVMTQQAWLMPYLARIYYSHISLGVCFLVYIYTFLPPSTFRRIRRTIAADNAIAFVIVTVWRCSPPRLLPQEQSENFRIVAWTNAWSPPDPQGLLQPPSTPC